MRKYYSKQICLANPISFEFFTTLKEAHFYIVYLLLLQLVLCCVSELKRTSSIMHFIFYFWSFETSGNIPRNQKILHDFDSFSQPVVCIDTTKLPRF